MEKFKKGDYIVVLPTIPDNTTYLKVNHVHHQDDDGSFIKAYLPHKGTVWHSNIYFKKKEWWRYASLKEIQHFKVVNKPYNINDIAVKSESFGKKGDYIYEGHRREDTVYFKQFQYVSGTGQMIYKGLGEIGTPMWLPHIPAFKLRTEYSIKIDSNGAKEFTRLATQREIETYAQELDKWCQQHPDISIAEKYFEPRRWTNAKEKGSDFDIDKDYVDSAMVLGVDSKGNIQEQPFTPDECFEKKRIRDIPLIPVKKRI